MVIAIATGFILPDLPHNSRGFSEDELRVAQLRMIEDVGEVDRDSEEDGIFSGLVMAFKDWKIWLMVLASFLFVLGLTFNAYFVSHHGAIILSDLLTKMAADLDADSWLFLRAHSDDVCPAMDVLRNRVSH